MENINTKAQSLIQVVKSKAGTSDHSDGKLSEHFTRTLYIIAITIWLHIAPLVVLIIGFIIAMVSTQLDELIKLPDSIAKAGFVDDYYLNMPITVSLILYFIVGLIAGAFLGVIYYMRYNTIGLPKIISLLLAFILTLSVAIVAFFPVFVMLGLSGGTGGYFIGISGGHLISFTLVQFLVVFGLSFGIAMITSKED